MWPNADAAIVLPPDCAVVVDVVDEMIVAVVTDHPSVEMEAIVMVVADAKAERTTLVMDQAVAVAEVFPAGMTVSEVRRWQRQSNPYCPHCRTSDNCGTTCPLRIEYLRANQGRGHEAHQMDHGDSGPPVQEASALSRHRGVDSGSRLLWVLVAIKHISMS